MNTYIERLIQLAQDVMNSYDPYLEEPEHLRHPEDLAHFLQDRNVPHAATLTANDLDEVKGLRQTLRHIWIMTDETALREQLNQLLATIQVIPQLANENSIEWQLVFQMESDAPLIERLRGETALGLAATLQQHGAERMKVCAAAPCQDVFIDTSRNRSRRFCGERCANRYNVAMFRERQRQ